MSFKEALAIAEKLADRDKKPFTVGNDPDLGFVFFEPDSARFRGAKPIISILPKRH